MEHVLSKLDIAALRAADFISIHLNRDNPDGLVRVVKRGEKTERTPFPVDLEHALPAAVTMNGYGWKELMQGGLVRCFAMVNFYHNQRTPASNVIKTLRPGDSVTFRFWPDAHSNGYVARAGLHADVLYMDVHRAKGGHTVRYEWKLETSICPENSARMCRGYPASESYHHAAREAATA